MNAIKKLSVGVLLLGLVAAPAGAQVIINEVLGSTVGSDSEYIELWNSGGSAVDIGFWSIELWDSDENRIPGQDAGSPYVIPFGTSLAAGDYYLMANALAEGNYGVTADLSLPSNAIENSPYTMILKDFFGNTIDTAYLLDNFNVGGADRPNDNGADVDPCVTWGPDGSFLPAGFFRICDGSGTLGLLTFNPQPSPRGTPGTTNGICAELDIKAGSCPNAYNRGSNGKIPVALLGSDTFDVSQVDLSTVQIAQTDEFFPGPFGSIGPNAGQGGIEDVGTATGNPGPCDQDGVCDCTDADGDGIDDLVMLFDTAALVAALELDISDPGANVGLKVTGNLFDGSAFAAADCVRLVPRAQPPGVVDSRSQTSGAYFFVSPMDNNHMADGTGNFWREFDQETPVTYTYSVVDSGSNPDIISGRQRFAGWKLDGEFLSPDDSVTFNVVGEIQLLEARFIRAGDFNDDAVVTLVDFAILANCFGTSEPSGSCSAETHSAVDMDRNGIVNLTDFAIFLLEFGVPEQAPQPADD